MKSERKSLREEYRMIRRGCSIIRGLSPGQLELSLLKSLLHALNPYIAIYFSSVIVDELTGNRDFGLLMIYVGVTVGGTLFFSFLSELILKETNIMNSMFDSRFQTYLNDKIMSTDYTLLEDPKCTELREKIRGNLFAARGGIHALVGQMASITENLLSVIIAVIILYNVVFTMHIVGSSMVNSVWFSLLFIAVILVCIVLTVKNSKTVQTKVFELYKNGATNNGYLQHYYYVSQQDDQAGGDVRIFDQRQLILDEIQTKGWLPWLNINNGKYSLFQKYLGINSSLSVLFGGLAYLFIGLKALSGTLSLGCVTRSYVTIIRVVSAVESLASSVSATRSNNYYLDLIYQYIDLPSDMHEGHEIPTERNDGWEIEFHDVSFRYPHSEKYALKNVSLKIADNNRIGFVGVNGSGKTTMIKLLCRLYSPESGFITLNGKDIKAYDFSAYSKLYSVVFQDFQLMAFPIGQNVAASREYDEPKIWRSLETAGVADRVRELPFGLRQTIYRNFDKEGVEISGGEAQKIALARALYKEAPLIVLDEPTAALDPVSEYEVYSKFNEMIGGKTAIFISHRLSSCRFCDSIAVFHDGQLVQVGPHATLLEDTDGKYRELWNAQAQYYA